MAGFVLYPCHQCHGCYSDPAEQFFLTFYGALLFMVSDLSLAYHKFVAAIPMSGVLVMLTYAFAQWLIVKGILDTESRRFTKA